MRCQRLTKIRFPAGLTEIKEKTFSVNYFLEAVELPSAVRVLDESAFAQCSHLRQILVPEGCCIIASNFCQRAEIQFYKKPEEG